MKVLLDECINRKFARDLPGLDVKTVRQMGWDSTRNGALEGLQPFAQLMIDALPVAPRGKVTWLDLP